MNTDKTATVKLEAKLVKIARKVAKMEKTTLKSVIETAMRRDLERRARKQFPPKKFHL